MKEVIAPEMAEQEFGRICDFFDVDQDDLENEKEEQAFERIKNKIVKAITRGSLTVEDSGAPTYTTKLGTELTFTEPNGATLLVKTADDDPMRKMLAIAISLTGGKATPKKLSIRDTGLLSAIVNLFMKELA